MHSAGQRTLSRDDRATLDRRAMSPRDEPIGRVIPVQPRQHLGSARGAAPVAHEVADDGEQRDDADAGGRHAVIGDVPDQRGGGAGSLHVGPHRIAFCPEREGAERSAWIV